MDTEESTPLNISIVELSLSGGRSGVKTAICSAIEVSLKQKKYSVAKALRRRLLLLANTYIVPGDNNIKGLVIERCLLL